MIILSVTCGILACWCVGLTLLLARALRWYHDIAKQELRTFEKVEGYDMHHYTTECITDQLAQRTAAMANELHMADEMTDPDWVNKRWNEYWKSEKKRCEHDF